MPRERCQRPDRGDKELPWPGRRFLLDLGESTELLQQNLPHRGPKADGIGQRSPDLVDRPDDDQEISRALGRNQMLRPTRLFSAGMPGAGAPACRPLRQTALEERW
jgi:hypothetical protein